MFRFEIPAKFWLFFIIIISFDIQTYKLMEFESKERKLFDTFKKKVSYQTLVCTPYFKDSSG